MQIKKTEMTTAKDTNIETKSRKGKMYSKKHKQEKQNDRKIGNETKEEIEEVKTKRKGINLSFKVGKNRS